MSQRPDLTETALDYAANGWQVFPLSRRKKPLFRTAHPDGDPLRHRCKGTCGRIGHGFYDATDDPAVIASWPWPMLGGRIPAGLMVLDIDPPEGEQSLTRHTGEHGPLPDTMTAWSGKGDGGRHLYFVRPPGPLSTVRLGDGIDLLHHTLRYAVLPPSPHPKTGLPYRWSDTTTIAQPPAWLVALLRPRLRPAYKRPASPSRQSPGRLAAWLAAQSSEPGTKRHDKVRWALGQAITDGADPAEIDQIKQAAEALGKPPAEIDAMHQWCAANTAREVTVR